MDRSFALPDWRGEVAPGVEVAGDLADAVGLVTDPGSANATLHWGRNYIYSTDLPIGDGSLPVVVKQFRNRGWVERLRRRFTGSKAEKSWRAAEAVARSGVRTPTPVLLVESRKSDGPSFFVTEQVQAHFEARYFFRALNGDRLAREFPEVDKEELLGTFGRIARRLHDAGIWHRDFSIGNLLVRTGSGLEVFVIDLNRARLKRRLGLFRRTRDICRLPVLAVDDEDAFLSGYWGSLEGVSRFKRTVFRLMVRAFLWKHRIKGPLRRPRKALAGRLRPRHAHEHIPAAPVDAAPRDRIVWDALSDQPHQHASRLARMRVRFGDLGIHAKTSATGLVAAPKILRRYRQLQKSCRSDRAAKNGVLGALEKSIGVGLRPHAEPEVLDRALSELGVRQVLLRLHPWQDDHTQEEDLARELHERGYDLAFALPQNRDLVKDRARWRAALTELGGRFARFGGSFQVGQAINRSKWGIWNYREYLEMAQDACEILRGFEGMEILGPAVIDFELQATAVVLNTKAEGVFFDVVTSLLYVDRRGPPENTQLGFDAAGKAILLRAIAETAKNSSERCWITEVNWPLWEGPHSPAGKSVAVDEEAQADYLVRYYLEVLGTGVIERIYWWRLFAKGYGLIDPSDGRRRPSFGAMATLHRQLNDATHLGRWRTARDVRAHRFRTASGREVVAAWTVGRSAQPARLELPRSTVAGIERDGAERQLSGPDVEVIGSPRYFVLEAE